MKINKLLAIGMIFLPTWAYSGQEGGGGDAVAFEFTTLAQSMISFLSAAKSLNPPVSSDDFKNVVANTLVRSADTLTLAGDEVDAINYPQLQKIEVNRARWSQDPADKKMALTLHEYLGILGKNDRDYQLSGPFMTKAFDYFSNQSLAEIENLNVSLDILHGVGNKKDLTITSNADHTHIEIAMSGKADFESDQVKEGAINLGSAEWVDPNPAHPNDISWESWGCNFSGDGVLFKDAENSLGFVRIIMDGKNCAAYLTNHAFHEPSDTLRFDFAGILLNGRQKHTTITVSVYADLFKTCGKDGTLDDRLADCKKTNPFFSKVQVSAEGPAVFNDAGSGAWDLIGVDENRPVALGSAWMSEGSGRLWGPALPEMTMSQAAHACGDDPLFPAMPTRHELTDEIKNYGLSRTLFFYYFGPYYPANEAMAYWVFDETDKRIETYSMDWMNPRGKNAFDTPDSTYKLPVRCIGRRGN